MGTLTDQPARKYRLVSTTMVNNMLEEAKDIARAQNVDIETVLEVYRILEMRRKNDLFVSNGDVFDEQMAGFGKLFEQFIERIPFPQD